MAFTFLHRTATLARRLPCSVASRRFMSRTPNKEQQVDVLKRMAGQDTNRYVPTDQEMEDFKRRAKAEDRMYNALMPDRNWGITHPVTWVLIAICVGLHFYTGYRQKEIDERNMDRKKEEAKLMNREYVEPNNPKKGWE